MANNDVVMYLRAKDLASPALQNLKRNMDATSQSMNRFGNSASKIDTIMGSMVGFTAAIAGFQGLTEAINGTVGAMLEYYKTMQQGSIATAGTLMSVTQLHGKDLNWNQAMTFSKDIMNKLANQAVATGVSTPELTSSFRAALPAAMQGGMTIDQLLKLLAPLTSAGKLIGLNDTTLMRDINDLFSGQNVGRTKLGQVLGIEGADIQKAKGEGKLYEFLQSRLQGEVEAVTHYLNTWEGRMNHLKESIMRVGGEGMAGAFDAIKDDVQEIAEQLVIVDSKTQDIYINQNALNSFKAIADLIKEASVQVKGLIADISGGAGILGSGAFAGLKAIINNLRTIIELYTAFVVGRKVVSTINDIKAGLYGTAEAHTMLGRAAQAATAEIVKEEMAQRSILRGQYKTDASLSVKSYGLGETAEQTEINQTTAAINRKATAHRNVAQAAQQAHATETALESTTRIAHNETTGAIERQALVYRNVQLSASQSATTESARATVVAQKNQVVNETLAMQSAQYRSVGVSATIMGVQADTAMYRSMSKMGSVVTGLKGIGKAVLALTGGWVGLGIAAATAIFEMNRAWKDNRKSEDQNKIVMNGEEYSMDKDGNLVVLKHLKEFDDWQKVNDSYGNNALSQEDVERAQNLIREHQLDMKAEELRKQNEEMKEIYKRVSQPDKGLTEQENKLASRQTHKGEEEEKSAKASSKLASTMEKNSSMIQRANERVANAITALENQLLRLNGSTYDSDIASAKQAFNDMAKQIKQGNVILSSAQSVNSNVPDGNGTAYYNAGADLDNINENTRTAMNMLLTEFHKRHPEVDLPVTSGRRYGDGTSHHDAGEAFDIAPSAFSGNPALRAEYGALAASLGLTPFDEYNGSGNEAYAHGENFHVTVPADWSPKNVTVETQGASYAAPNQNKANELNQQVLDEKIKEAQRQLEIRQRKQSYSTNLNELATNTNEDTRQEQILAEYAEKIAEVSDRKKDIFKSIAGDTTNKDEKARAEAETEKAMAVETTRIEQEKAEKIRDLENTIHSEKLEHMDNEAYMQSMTADQITSMRIDELNEYIKQKQKELQEDKLTASERIKVEKDVVAAVKQLNDEKGKSIQGGLDNLKRNVQGYSVDASAIFKDMFNNITNAWGSWSQNLMTEHKSLGQRLSSMWKSILNSILNAFAQFAAQRTLQNIITAFTGNKGNTNPAGHAYGGLITGPGTGTSDSIPSMLSNGEYVLNARAVKKVGVGFLDSINYGYVKHFANGGYVGNSSGGSISPVNVVIQNNTGTQMQASQRETRDDSGRQIHEIILTTVSGAITNNEMHMKDLIAGVR